MFNINSLLTTILAVLFLSSIQSFADTFVVTNLNDPGAGSLRQAIVNSNLNPGPDEIVFEEGLEGTIVLNVGSFLIQDDLTITGTGADKITIDADGKSSIFDVNDFDDGINRIVKISRLRLINADDVFGLVANIEILTVDSCQFINGKGEIGGAILNSNILTVNSCLFKNNSAIFGGAINNGGATNNNAIIASIKNSEFINNEGRFGGAIENEDTIEVITNSTFTDNNVSDVESSGGAIRNYLGTINEISHCTFDANTATIAGGAIFNSEGIIKNIVNSTFMNNIALTGSAIRNDGVVNISFTTLANNASFPPPPGSPFTMERAGIVTVGFGITRLRNSIIDSNSPDNCFGFIDDFGGNYSDDFSCGLFGDGSEIILGPLADNGGPTETMALLGGDPLDGATVNCDALNEMGNPSGIPIGVDQRYFPRPFGIRCDSGAVESMPASIVTITKASQPRGIEGFEFVSNGFGSLVGCGIKGDSGKFTLDDGGSESCIVPVGDYTIREKVPNGYRLFIVCFGENPNLIIDNEKGEIIFSVPEIEPSPDVDCIFNNIKKGKSGGGCALAGSSNNYSFPLYLFIPALILIRRVAKRYRS